MFTKVFCLAAVVYAVSAQSGHGHGREHGHAYSSQHIHKHDGHAHLVTFKDKHGHEHHDYYSHPEYKFAYKVVDEHKGYKKSREEHRGGDDVKGSYELDVKHYHTRHHY